MFAYGATGAGKTHTMLGTESHPGVIYHTMIYLYKQIGLMSKEKTCDVAVSYLEVSFQWGSTASTLFRKWTKVAWYLIIICMIVAASKLSN